MKEVRIGRALENDIVIEEKTVSREHCVIAFENEFLRVIDQKSMFGSLVKFDQPFQI